jgi:type IV pilus secretin PilQ/predicted competence protein
MKIISTILLLWIVAVQTHSQTRLSPLPQENTRLYDFSFAQSQYGAVFQGIATLAGVDIVLAPDLRGEVTIRLTQKTWQETLDIICARHNLVWLVRENHIYIMDRARHQADEVQRLSLEKNIESTMPLIRKSYFLRYARTEEVMPVLRGLLSPNGRLNPVERNNALIVYDVEPRLLEIDKTLAELDIAPRQVIISAKLVVADSKFLQELGVDWSAKTGSGAIPIDQTQSGQFQDRNIFDTRTSSVIRSVPAGTPGLFSNPATSISTQLLDGNMSITINQLLSDERTELLASPQITTLNHKQAEIFMGEQVSIRVVDAQGVGGVQMQEAGIRLNVTPHITGNDEILLELAPENNTFRVDAGGQPIISKQQAKTEVLVKDGATLVIAGLTKNEESEIESGIPLLKDIPLFGYLFKHVRKEIVKKDLIIFVTPKIVKDDPAIAAQTSSTQSVDRSGSVYSEPTQQQNPVQRSAPQVAPTQNIQEQGFGLDDW